MTTPESKTRKNQSKTFVRSGVYYCGQEIDFHVNIRWDDRYQNGRNCYMIDCEVWLPSKFKAPDHWVTGGIMDTELKEHFPELERFIKWRIWNVHDCFRNTINHVKNDNFGLARESALWPDATIEQLRDKEQVTEHLSNKIAEFKQDIEALGFVF